MALDRLSETRCFGGVQRRYTGSSQVLAGDAVFSVFLPDFVASNPVPVLFYLSGLTCTDENATRRAGRARRWCRSIIVRWCGC